MMGVPRSVSLFADQLAANPENSGTPLGNGFSNQIWGAPRNFLLRTEYRKVVVEAELGDLRQDSVLVAPITIDLSKSWAGQMVARLRAQNPEQQNLSIVKNAGQGLDKYLSAADHPGKCILFQSFKELCASLKKLH
jgi:hypothetical protein